MKKVQKRYIFLTIIMIVTGILIWKISSSYASMDVGFTGKNIISGDKWGINITSIDNIVSENNGVINGEISTIGTTLNFDTTLFEPGDKVSFDITVENTSSLNAELYALTLSGVSVSDSEAIDYIILPIDSSLIHEDSQDGSIIKSGEKQMFNITVSYNSDLKNNKEYNLNLGATIIYKQR